MADVKWIKLATDIFDNKKIRQIETMPEGDAIIVIWLKLLCLAGNVNENGFLYLTKEIPYTEQMLATHFNRPISIVQLALQTFLAFGMIEVIDDVLYVSAWEKYQNCEQLERIREQGRIRQARYKERKRLAESNVIGDVTDDAKVTHGNATDKEIDKEKDIEKDSVPPKSPRRGETEFDIPFTGDLLEAFSDWIAYKQEKKQGYKPRGLQSLVTQVKRYAEQFGEDDTANAIRNSMASNYQGIVFDRIGKTQQAKTAETRKRAKSPEEYKGDDFIAYLMEGKNDGA